MLNVATGDTSVLREVNANEFAEARRVVIAHSLRIAERLQHRVRLHDLVLERHLQCLFMNDAA